MNHSQNRSVNLGNFSVSGGESYFPTATKPAIGLLLKSGLQHMFFVGVSSVLRRVQNAKLLAETKRGKDIHN